MTGGQFPEKAVAARRVSRLNRGGPGRRRRVGGALRRGVGGGRRQRRRGGVGGPQGGRGQGGGGGAGGVLRGGRARRGARGAPLGRRGGGRRRGPGWPRTWDALRSDGPWKTNQKTFKTLLDNKNSDDSATDRLTCLLGEETKRVVY